MGFILIELALLQKLILLLGNPTTTFAILLFTLLISGGSGSLLSSRVARNNMKNLIFVIGGIAALALFYVLFLPSIVYSSITEPFYVKAVVAAVILAPIGFLMGMPFPTGIRLLKAQRSEYIPWMWAINGAFSVLGAVLAIALGRIYGLSYAMILGVFDVPDCIRNIFRIEEKDHSSSCGMSLADLRQEGELIKAWNVDYYRSH